MALPYRMESVHTYATQTLMIISVPYLEVLIFFRQRFICLRKAQHCVQCGCRRRKHHLLGLGRQSGGGREGQVLCGPLRHILVLEPFTGYSSERSVKPFFSASHE